MSYVFLLILLFPVKLIRKLFRKDTGRNLVIQTAKIGDFINATPLLAYLQKSDVLISRSVSPLAQHDDSIEEIFFVEQQKRNLWRKLCFACLGHESLRQCLSAAAQQCESLFRLSL